MATIENYGIDRALAAQFPIVPAGPTHLSGTCAPCISGDRAPRTRLYRIAAPRAYNRSRLRKSRGIKTRPCQDREVE
jgi:hypothetical protein